MRKRRLWLYFLAGGVLMVAATALVVWLEPTRIGWGLLTGEPFFRERPLSYWREVLRKHGREGYFPREITNKFWDTRSAFPVLRACARDPDPNVRWPAIALLSQGDLRSREVLDLLVESLGDEVAVVRLKAVAVLALWGPMAREAVPALAARLQDSELQVAHYADLAVWQIDPTAAPSACGWRPFTSEEFGISLMVPGEPERKNRPVLEGMGVGHGFQCWHQAGIYQAPTRYFFMVVDYKEGLFDGTTEEERFRAMKEATPLFFPTGTIVEDKEVSLGELRGRDYLLEVEGIGKVQNRLFWVGQKLYGVGAAYKPEFLNEPALAYFMDSFRVTPMPAKGNCQRSSGSPP
jgi:hypothetical protein